MKTNGFIAGVFFYAFLFWGTGFAFGKDDSKTPVDATMEKSYQDQIIGSEKINQEMGGFMGGVASLMGYGGFADGLKEYFSLTGVGDYAGQDSNIFAKENLGIVRHFVRTFNDSPCLQKTSLNFYKEVESLDDLESGGPLSGRASLSEPAADPQHSKYQKGWLWRLALKHSGNDPNVALFLIGICGHDDQKQIGPQGFHTLLKGEDARLYLKEERAILYARLNKIQSSPSAGSKGVDEVGLTTNLDYLDKAITNDWPPSLFCPDRDSPMFLPESLGDSVDISPSLKKEIVSIQAPIKGASSLPAKYYHVMGSAYMACDLKQKGVSDKSIREILKMGAWGYRYIRFRNANAELLKFKKAAQMRYLEAKKTTKYPNSFPDEYEWLQEDMSQGIAVGHQLLKKSLNTEAILKNTTVIADYDAAFLMDKTVFKDGKVFGYGTDGKLSTWDKMKIMMSLTDKMKERRLELMNGKELDQIASDEKWSWDRLHRAKERLNSWLVDWEWTIAQHKAGAEFAISQCKSEGQSLEESCVQHAQSKLDTNGPPEKVVH